MFQCKNNNWITNIVAIAIQVTFVFAFLTVFFFVYVQHVEKNEFVSQMNLIVDNITKDFEKDIPDIIKEQSVDDKNDITIIINGIIDTLEEKIAIDAKNIINDTLEKNHQVKLKALKSLTFVISIVVIIIIILFLLGFCIPIQYQIKEAMLVVIFVGLTELIFLTIITQKYISASPNKVKKSFAQSIQNWINNNHKL